MVGGGWVLFRENVCVCMWVGVCVGGGVSVCVRERERERERKEERERGLTFKVYLNKEQYGKKSIT